MLHLISALVLGLIAAGLWFRRTPRLHLRFMTAAFIVDVGLLLYIEGTRAAVAQVAASTAPIVWVHAAISTLVLVAYVMQIVLGRRTLAGMATSRQAHIVLGLTFVALRSLNYVTSFFV